MANVLTEEQRSNIREYRSNGMSYGDISIALGITRNTI